MLVNQVSKLPVKERFLYWIRERQSIYTRKVHRHPKPWTDDEILQSYKFCNVRRIDDRVSQWLLKEWYRPFKDHPNMLLACSLARQLNNTESLGLVGFPEKWNPVRAQKLLELRAAKGLKNYSAAYMITSNYGERGREPQTKAFQTVWTVCDPIAKSGLCIDPSSMRSTWQSLLCFQGFSSFISGQVVADLRWGVSGAWKDKTEWAPMGPGSQRGLNRIMKRDKEEKITQSQFDIEVGPLYHLTIRKTNIKMEMMDFQNCLCEFDKYERVLHGEGRPKSKYPGRS